VNLGVLTLTCHIFEAPLGTGSYNTYFNGKRSGKVKVIREDKDVAALSTSIRGS